MSFLKSLWADLREKRLWPVAVGLLAALVAVPMLLGGDAEIAAPVGATGATGAAAQTAQVALDLGALGRGNRRGEVRDPFKQDPRAKVKTATTGTTGVDATAATASSSGTGTGSSTSGASSASGSLPQGTTGRSGAGGGSSAAEPSGSSPDAYSAVLRYGLAASKRPRRTILELTPLPSTEDPSVVYLGATPSGKAVTLLLSEGVTAKGEGACKPSKASCESLQLEPGDHAELTVTDDAGATERYVVDLVSIAKS